MKEAPLTEAEKNAGAALAGNVSNAVQELLLARMNCNHFGGARNAILNGALWGLCSVAKSARDASPPDPEDRPLEVVVAEQAALFFAAMAADEAMGIEQGNA